MTVKENSLGVMVACGNYDFDFTFSKMNSALFEPSLKYYLIILFYFFLSPFFKFLSVGRVFKEDKNFRR
jgi:hypothetical protein